MSDKDLIILNTTSKDTRSKYFLSTKEAVAAVLHYLVPGFEVMTIKEIIKECLDPVNRNESFMDIYTTEIISVNSLKFIEDLTFLIKVPEHLRKEGKPDRFLLHLEIQNQKVRYPLEIRMATYHSDLFLKENQFLDIKTTEEFYWKAIPVLSIWFLFNQNMGETFTETADDENPRFNNDYFHSKPIIVNIDKDIPSNKPIYGIIKDLIEGSEKEVKQTLDSLGAKKDEKGNIMIYEQVIAKTLETGEARGEAKRTEELRNKALERFENGEIDNKQYEYLVEFLDTKE